MSIPTDSTTEVTSTVPSVGAPKVSGDSQTIELHPSSNGFAGGEGLMQPQVVVVRDANGRPRPGVPVTFTVDYNHPVYANMPPYGATSVTVATDQSGYAAAANQDHSMAGQGFRVHSQAANQTRMLTVTATAAGMAPVTFFCTIQAVSAPAAPLTLTAVSGDNQTINADDTTRFAGGEGNAAPFSVLLKDANQQPVCGQTIRFTAATTAGFIMSAEPSRVYADCVTGTDGRATCAYAGVVSMRPNTQTTFTMIAQATGLSAPEVLFSGRIIAYSPPASSVPGTLSAVGPVAQSVTLGNPTSDFPGGQALCVAQAVVITDVNGKPIPGVTVSFEINDSHPVYGAMSPHGATVIARVTDERGIAAAGNTYSLQLGQGFQIYSYTPGANAVLNVNASALGMNTVTFAIHVSSH